MLVIGIYCFQTVSTCNRRAMEEFQRQNKKTSTLPRYLTSIIDYLHKKCNIYTVHRSYHKLQRIFSNDKEIAH
jgi:hypothetical protein